MNPLQRGLKFTPSPRVMFEVPMQGPSVASFRDHRVQGQGIFPGAGHLEVASAALRAVGNPSGAAALAAVTFHAPYVLNGGPLRVAVEMATGRIIVAGMKGPTHMSGSAIQCTSSGYTALMGGHRNPMQATGGRWKCVADQLGLAAAILQNAAIQTAAIGSTHPDEDIFPCMLVSPAALDAALQLAAVPMTAPTHSPPTPTPTLMIPAGLACFHLPMRLTTGAPAMQVQSRGFASAARVVGIGTDAASGSAGGNGVLHDHALQSPHDPAAACRITALQAKPLQAGGALKASPATNASHMAGQGCLQVVWQVETPSPIDPLTHPLTAGNPAGSTAVSLQQVGGAAHAMGDLVAALQRSMSTSKAMTHQLVTMGSHGIHDIPTGRMAGAHLKTQSGGSQAFWAVLRCLAREAPTTQITGSNVGALAAHVHGSRAPAYLVSAPAGALPAQDRTDGHGISADRGTNLVPLLKQGHAAKSEGELIGSSSRPTVWLITGEVSHATQGISPFHIFACLWHSCFAGGTESRFKHESE